jgi:hypothetical protein
VCDDTVGARPTRHRGDRGDLAVLADIDEVQQRAEAQIVALWPPPEIAMPMC